MHIKLILNNDLFFLGGSVGGLHKSMTRLSSSQQINNIPIAHSSTATPPLSNNVIVTNTNKSVMPNFRVLSGGVTVTTITQPRMQRPLSQGPLTLMSSSNQNYQVRLTKFFTKKTTQTF